MSSGVKRPGSASTLDSWLKRPRSTSPLPAQATAPLPPADDAQAVPSSQLNELVREAAPMESGGVQAGGVEAGGVETGGVETGGVEDAEVASATDSARGIVSPIFSGVSWRPARSKYRIPPRNKLMSTILERVRQY